MGQRDSTLSFSKKILLFVTASSSLALLLACTGFIVYDSITFRESILSTLREEGQIIAANSTAAISFKDQEMGVEILSALKSSPHIMEACLYNKEGVLFVRNTIKGEQVDHNVLPDKKGHAYKDNILYLYVPVIENDEEVGSLFLKRDLTDESERLARYFGISALVLLISLSLITVAGFFFVKKILAPVQNAAEQLTTSAQELSQTSEGLSSNAETSSNLVASGSSAAEEVRRNVQTVAMGIEQLGESVTEIARNATLAAKVGSEAVVLAESANKEFVEFSENSSAIGNIVRIIADVADQTNLLALNASIEAARAGDAGRGFSVVANEVKELANETAKATESIGKRIGAIEAGTKSAVENVNKIHAIINKINEVQNNIAAAVDQQSATVGAISVNANEVAKGCSVFAEEIGRVAVTSNDTTESAKEIMDASKKHTLIAAELKSLFANRTTQMNGAKDADTNKDS